MNKRIKILTKILLFTIFLIILTQTNVFATEISTNQTTTTEISNIEITNVTMPVAGEKPTLTATVPENANYQISSEFWYDDETNTQLDAEFEAGKSYTYYSMVYPTTGSMFGSNVTATVNGNDMKFESNEGNLLVFSYKIAIPATDDTNNDDANKKSYKLNIIGDVEVFGESIITDASGQIMIQEGDSSIGIMIKEGYFIVGEPEIVTTVGSVTKGEDGRHYLKGIGGEVTITAQTEKYKYYNITEGNNQTWNGKGDLRIVCDGDFDKFASLLLGIKDANSIPILEENVDYSVESGSTIVTVKESYLKTLAIGEYNVIFVYNDGEATANLTVAEVKSEETDNTDNDNQNDDINSNSNKDTNSNKNNGINNPQTGDKIIFSIAVLGTAIIALMATTKFNKKQK